MTHSELKTICDAMTILMMVQYPSVKKADIPDKYVSDCLKRLSTIFNKYKKGDD